MVRDDAMRIANDLYGRVIKNGDMRSNIVIKDSKYADSLSMDAGRCRIGLQYLEDKGYIVLRREVHIVVTVKAALIDLIENQT